MAFSIIQFGAYPKISLPELPKHQAHHLPLRFFYFQNGFGHKDTPFILRPLYPRRSIFQYSIFHQENLHLLTMIYSSAIPSASAILTCAILAPQTVFFSQSDSKFAVKEPFNFSKSRVHPWRYSYFTTSSKKGTTSPIFLWEDRPWLSFRKTVLMLQR